MKRGWKYLKEQLRRPLVAGVAGVILLLIIGAGAYATIGGSSPFAPNPINLQKGLIGWWKLNGNLKDSTPYGNNGTPAGTAPTATTDRKGAVSGAEYFNGSGSIVSPNINVANGPYTVSLWVYVNAYTSNTGGGSVGLVGNTAGIGAIDGDIHLGIRNYHIYLGQYGDDLGGSSTLTTNTWYNIVYMIDSSKQQRVYLNGVLDGSKTASGYLTNGLNEYGTGPFDGNLTGSLSDIRVYNRAVSAAEVVALYGQYNPAVKADSGANGLIGQWKFNGNYKDATPLANNLTVSGTTLVADRKGSASSALNSNGTSDYVYGQIGNGTYFGGNNPLSVSAWVYVTATSSGPIFGMTAAPPGGGWNMPFLSLNGTTVYGWIYNNTPISTTAGANQWHHIAMTYNPGGSPTTILYLDGQQAGTATGTYAAGGANYFTTYLSGVKPNAGVANYLNTPISDIRAYSRVLSAADVAAQYNSYNSQLSIGGSGAPGSVSLGKGLVGDWAMNGNAKDNTPYGNNGTINGATLTTDRKGRANSAYSFNGTSDYIGVGSVPQISATSNWTVSFWMKPNAVINYQNPFDANYTLNGGDTGPRFEEYSDHTFTPNGNFGFALSSVGGPLQGFDLNTELVAGSWYFVAATRNANTIQAYVNGSQTVNQSNTNWPPSFANTVIGVGYQNLSGRYFNGSIDDVRIYNRGLSAAEVTSLYGSYR